MVAGMAAPAYADVYYIGDGNITITKDENGTQVQQGNSTKNDTDRDIVIKGGTNPANTASGGSSSGSNSSKSTTLAKSPAQSNLTTLNSEDDSDSEAEDKVYLGDTKGGGEENENQTGGTTGGEKNETDFTKKTQPSRSPVLESQITYTGPSLKVADANDDEETRDESTTALKTAAENFRNTAENVTNYVIRIINKVKDSTLNVTLEDVNIKANNDAALSVEGAGNTTITLKGDNTLTSDGKHAGLEHNEKSDGGATTGKLTITSETDKNGNNTSSLTATGSGGSAGIGSAWSKSGSSTGAGTIEIVGGDIKAIGASSAAGIGSGYGATSDTDIIISGTAKIEAESTYGGAGIGSGNGSNGSTIINIEGGTITAEGGGKENGSCQASGAGIGSGGNALNKTTINIKGGEITATGGVSLDSRNHSDKWLSGAGIGSGSSVSGETEINISGDSTIKSASGGKYGGAGIGSGSYSGSTPDNQKGAVTINISGGTIEKATGGGEYVPSSKRWYSGAGIGSGSGDTKNDSKKGAVTINITDGTIEKAEGKDGGAGIGSGYYGRSSTVNISGNAELKDVKGGNLAAGIGSGYDSDKVDVVIDGGAIKATGGDSAAGIGSGHNSRSSVIIKSGTVNAAGNQHSNSGSSGIGGSYADVTISGGTITATGYGTGAGIGSFDDNSSNITITGGTITATGNDKAPAIGNGSVSISNADAPLDITATAPVANKAIQSSDGKTLDAVIRLAENGKKGLVKLVKSGTDSLSRLFHNGAYAANHSTFHSHDRVTPEMSEAEKAKYGDIASVHNWKVSDRQEPNCGKDGYIEYTCMVGKCGATFRHTLPATGQHTWNEGVVTKEPTCTADGVRTFTCSVCGDTRTEAIKALGHEYGEWVIDRDATCVEEGSKHRDCIRGDDTQTEAIPVSKTHTFGEWVITKEPTCTEKGERQRSCTISGCVVTETEELPALGHQWSDWTPVKGDSSREYRICEVCNEVEYRDVSHNSDSSISTGLRVLDPAQTNIIQNVQLVQLSQINHTLYIHVAQETASLQGDLSDLTDLRSENIKTVVFSTVSCTSTLSLSDVAALGAGSTPFILSHSGSTASFIVGGADHSALLR